MKKIKQRIFILNSLCSIIPLLLMGTILFFVAQNIGIKHAEEQLNLAAEITQNNIEEALELLEGYTAQWEGNHTLIEYLYQTQYEGKIDVNKEKQFTESINNLIKSHDMIINANILDAKGVSFYYAWQKHFGIESKIIDFRESTHVQRAIDTGKTALSDVFMGVVVKKPILVIATPLYHEQILVGFVTISVDVQQLSETYKKPIGFAKSAHSYIIDYRGQTILHDDSAQLLTSNLAESAVGKRIMEEKNGMFVYEDEDTEAYMVRFEYEPGKKWYYIEEVKLEEYMEVACVIQKTMWAIIGLIIGILLVSLYLYSKKLAGEIYYVNELLYNLQSGDYSMRLRENDPYLIDDLVHSFNAFTEELENERKHITLLNQYKEALNISDEKQRKIYEHITALEKKNTPR